METENNQNVETETTATPEVETNSEVKEFTQKDVNKMIKERLAKEKKNQPSKEEMEKFHEWENSQKDQETKYQEALSGNQKKDVEISELKKEKLILKSGIYDDDDVDYIKFKVSKMEGDFEDNLKEYLATNPKFNKKQETKATGIDNKSQSVDKEDGVMAILKAKYPDIL